MAVAAIRYRASWRAVSRWGFNTAIAAASTAGLTGVAVRDGSGLANALAGVVLVVGVPLTALGLFRLCLEAGIAPRAYVAWDGDLARAWTVASRLSGRVVSSRPGAPIAVTRQYHTTRGVLGGSTGDWVVLADGTTRIAMTVYSYREEGALEGLVAAVLATGIVAEETAPIGRP